MNKLLLLSTATLVAAPAFGQNDECTGAVSIAANTPTAYDTSAASTSAPAWPCALGGTDIWFSYTVVGTATDILVTTCGSSYDTAVEIFSGDCNNLVSAACNDDACGLQSTATTTGGLFNAGDVVLFRVGGFNANSGPGTVEVREFSTPTCTTPDMFEDSDDCGTAAPITNGSYPGLNVSDGDNDFYAVTVPNGSTLDVTIFFIDSFADTDLYLWDPLIACDTSVAGTGTGSGALAVGFSVTDDETVTYTNTTGADQNLIIEVDMFTGGGCNDYELMVSGAGVGGPGSIGTNYCSTNPNSSGASGVISAFGLTSVAANNVTLTASSLPANQFGIFITSTTVGFVPNAGGTSNGNLCLGGQIGRYVGAGQILSAGAMGEFSLAIDLTAIPQGGGTVAAMAGTSRSFQAWHRDSVGLGSNFTDGITIGFTN